MFPSILAKQLQKGIGDYIETTFPMTNEPFKGSVEHMVEETKEAVYREPYVAVRLPFRVAQSMPSCFQSIHMQFKPYVHQEKAFERLTGNDGRSTLIATGTGSGKTECFLYPILEYCYRHRGEPGIKALIIYPMNALASDQARRIAELINESPELKGNITAGMYVGGEKPGASSRMMTEHGVITDHETMLNSAPDILMTNYKMLDYLLVRPKDASLWRDNTNETLKYIAVDELHTFDGAQGTDLACLLRRLKARLGIMGGYLTCVGTSATMGGSSSSTRIREYAESIFGEPFENDSVVTEDRLSAEEFFDGCEKTDFAFPTVEQVEKLEIDITSDDADGFIRDAVSCWITDDIADPLSDEGRILLHEKLLHNNFFQNMIMLMGGNYYQVSYIVSELKNRFPDLTSLGSLNDTAINALFALTSHARVGTVGHLRPFLNVQVQLWLRELRRLVASVDADSVNYSIAYDLNKQQSSHYLPVVNCRDCGATGWVSYANEQQNVTMHDLSAFYPKFFDADDHVVMMYPYREDQEIPQGVNRGFLCPECMKVKFANDDSHDAICDACGTGMVPVLIPNLGDARFKAGSKKHKQYVCPFCGSRRGIALMGVRAATEISAEVTQLFSSRFNDDKKTLAFSDNVQDAAHRAGFFNARTWRFGLRSAIQKYVQDGGADLSLADFTTGFIKYWRETQGLSKEDYVSMFIAPNMTWMHSYEDMIADRKLKNDRLATKLIADIESRLSYEIMLEYGLAASVGRTLEKSGCSTIYFPAEDIEKIADQVQERVVNELGEMTSVDIKAFRRMVVGFLNTMRRNGAFDDEAFYQMVQNDFKFYLLSADYLRCMPGLQSGRNTPRFLVEYRGSGRGKKNSYDSYKDRKYTDWIAHCSNIVLPNTENVYEMVAKIILEESVRNGIVSKLPSTPEYDVYGLNKEHVFISQNVVQMRCSDCGSVHSVPEENKELWDGAHCLRTICQGDLEEDPDAGLDYYGKLFSDGDTERVNAREHTGLLERPDRESLEDDFKRGADTRRLWDPNVLSCTPTLEMGIDIGDLSSVILCNMPPAQAQFLQRAGRAGRKDGNALTLIVANARPHDLYFYADPMDMISGDVEPPKIFLNASAVLERQFVAFCMDSWVRKGIPEEAIPKKVGNCLNKLESHPNDVFPFNFLDYVQNNTTNRLNSFIQLFPELETATKDELHDFAQGKGMEDSPMYVRVLDKFNALKGQRDSVSKNIDELDDMIKVLKAKPKDSSIDDEIAELNSEKKALQEVKRVMGEKDVFNFLSDEGLLPNYAFPEAGIVLKTILYRKEDQEDQTSQKKNYQKMLYEYHRSASAAISEFAPGNTFYADGRKMEIDQIDVSTAQPAKWRLCPNCAYAEEEAEAKLHHIAECPRCHCTAWADSGQVRNMLKVQMVYSNMDYTKDLISDESDDRTVAYYNKQLLVDVDEDLENNVPVAYEMDNDEFPFGYEYVNKATLREINFGANDMVGDKLTVSGREGVAKGFRICKYCGKIIPDGANGYNSKHHSRFCKSQKMSPIEQENSVEECLFLYRQFETEALRILVPATTLDVLSTESFVAAFMLGLKEKFGNIDHLRATVSEMPVPEKDERKQYLVIYDSVPGGTGYLKQFIANDSDDPEQNLMVQILENALKVMENCSCKDDEQKDGCYHCLYAYRQSNNIGNISRRSAMKLLRSILSGKKRLTKIKNISNIDPNPLFGSELERRFIAAFEQSSSGQHVITTTPSIVNGKEGYILKVNGVTWEIEPQVRLDAEQGVVFDGLHGGEGYCVPDFVIWPVTQKDKLPVAVFTDGYDVHKNEVDDDTLKREAIRRSGHFIVWGLTYKDVQNVFKEAGDYYTNALMAEKMPSGPNVYQRMITDGKADLIRPDKMSTFDLLLRYLEIDNAIDLFATHAKAYSLSLLRPADLANKIAFMGWNSEVSKVINSANFKDSDYQEMDTLFGTWAPRSTLPLIKIYAGVSVSEMKQNPTMAADVIIVLDDRESVRTDKYIEEWNGFWKFYNVMQFLPHFIGVSTVGIEENIYSRMPIENIIPSATPVGDEHSISEIHVDPAWKEIFEEELEYSPDEAKEFAKKLMELGISAPDSIGYETGDLDDAVSETVEMAWTDLKIGYLTEDQLSSKAVLEKAGWKIFDKNSEIDASAFGGEN